MKSLQELVASGVIFQNLAETRTNEPFLSRISRIVADAMWPFTPTVWLSLSEPSFLDNIQTIWIEAKELPLLPFKHKFNRSVLEQAYYPNDVLIADMSERLFDHFRYRPSLPVEEHIVLGEE